MPDWPWTPKHGEADIKDKLEVCSVYQEKYGLFHATPGCDGKIVGGDNYSGVKCNKCQGWYCA